MAQKQDILLHINEDLNDVRKEALLQCLNVRYGITKSNIDPGKEHMLFVSYDPEFHAPHDLVTYAEGCGVHAHLVDL